MPGLLLLIALAFGLWPSHTERTPRTTCFVTGAGALRVCHDASAEGVFYQPSRWQVAYNTLIIRLGDGRYATVLHSEAEDMARFHARTGGVRPGDSIKSGSVEAASDPDAMLHAPANLAFRIWGSLSNPRSPLYYAYSGPNGPAAGLSGGGNPMVVRGRAEQGDSHFYMFFLGVMSDGGHGSAWRNVLLEARTRDFVTFDLLEADAQGRPAWRPFAGADALPAIVVSTSGKPITSQQPAPVETGESGAPGRPRGAVVTAGLIGSIVRTEDRYYYFYTDQDAEDPRRNHLYLRTADDVATNARWSEPRIIMDTPPEMLIRVAKASGVARWAVFYNCLRSLRPFVSDICLQYTATLAFDGPSGLGGLILFDRGPGLSCCALGLRGAGANLKGQQFYLADEDGNLAPPPQGGDGLLTWTDIPPSFNVFGAPVYWGRWAVATAR